MNGFGRPVAKLAPFVEHPDAERRVDQRREIEDGLAGLLAESGVGPVCAAQLVVSSGDPTRMASEASFARLCGVSPIEASSGKVVRHRLNRGGNRDANRALHMICMVRMGQDRRTREYVARRTAEGKSKREILRCLKRYVAREVYRVLVVVEASPSTTAYPGASSGRLSVVS